MCHTRAPDIVVRRAIGMLRRNHSQDDIITAFGDRFTWAQIQAGMDHLRAVRRALYERKYIGRIAVLGIGGGPKIPQDVVERAEQRKMLRHTDLTAELLGDPLPGEDALSLRNVRRDSPSIVSDPLDALVFGRSRAA